MQEVEYVKEEAKLEYLLACLQKTAPPTLIFAESKGDVDKVHEHLLLNGVEAVSVHGGKDQEDRVHAIDSFKVRLTAVRQGSWAHWAPACAGWTHSVPCCCWLRKIRVMSTMPLMP